MNSSPSTNPATVPRAGARMTIPLAARRHAVVARVAEALQQRMCLPPAARVVVGVSGGADSVALLIALAVIARRRESADRLVAEPIACHVHHNLRVDGHADADEQWVRDLCDRLGIRCEVQYIDPASQTGNLEANARRMRYAALQQIARDANAVAIAVAHHADDQLETMLMAFARGAGPQGLAGMRWQRPLDDRLSDGRVCIIRPLLGVRRADCESLCKTAGVQWREDASNADTAFARNRVRKDILPEIERLWPGAADRTSHMADLMRVCSNLLDAHLQDTFGSASDRSWSRAELRLLDATIIVAGLRRAILNADDTIAEDLSSRSLGDAAATIRGYSTQPKQFHLPAGWCISVGAHQVSIHRGLS